MTKNKMGFFIVPLLALGLASCGPNLTWASALKTASDHLEINLDVLPEPTSFAKLEVTLSPAESEKSVTIEVMNKESILESYVAQVKDADFLVVGDLEFIHLEKVIHLQLAEAEGKLSLELQKYYPLLWNDALAKASTDLGITLDGLVGPAGVDGLHLVYEKLADRVKLSVLGSKTSLAETYIAALKAEEFESFEGDGVTNLIKDGKNIKVSVSETGQHVLVIEIQKTDSWDVALLKVSKALETDVTSVVKFIDISITGYTFEVIDGLPSLVFNDFVYDTKAALNQNASYLVWKEAMLEKGFRASFTEEGYRGLYAEDGSFSVELWTLDVSGKTGLIFEDTPEYEKHDQAPLKAQWDTVLDELSTKMGIDVRGIPQPKVDSVSGYVLDNNGTQDFIQIKGMFAEHTLEYHNQLVNEAEFEFRFIEAGLGWQQVLAPKEGNYNFAFYDFPIEDKPIAAMVFGLEAPVDYLGVVTETSPIDKINAVYMNSWGMSLMPSYTGNADAFYAEVEPSGWNTLIQIVIYGASNSDLTAYLEAAVAEGWTLGDGGVYSDPMGMTQMIAVWVPALKGIIISVLTAM